MELLRATILLPLLAMFACRAEGAPMVPAIYVFGDSTVDVGNNNYVPNTTAKADFPHYGIDYPGGVPTGRFSNGYNGADFLAMKLGFKQSPPPFLSLTKETQMLRGVSFASAGTGILDITGTAITLTEQVADFKAVTGVVKKRMGEQRAAILLSKSLFLISTGSNDMFAYYSRYGPQNNTMDEQFIALLVAKFADHLTALYELGARKFGITGTSHIGCVPFLRSSNPSGRCVENLNSLSRKFNRVSKIQVHLLSSELDGFEYSYGNSYDLVSQMRVQPALFGFKEINSACCGSGRLNGASACTPNATYCWNRGEYFFWDWIHPTQATSKLLALKLFSGPRRFATPINLQKLAEH